MAGSMNYDVNPDALKTIESKMRQMQATGANITPEMMQALYESVLEVGADKAQERGRIEMESKARASSEAAATKRFDRAMDAKEAEGLGSAIGNTLLYGGRYAAKKGYLDKLNPFGKTEAPGGTTTPGPLKTVGGSDITPELGMKSTLFPEGNPLAGAGDTTGLELAPATQPGPITTPAVTAQPFGGVPTEMVGELGEAPFSVAETAPLLEEAAPTTIGELGGETLAETAGETAGEMGATSYLGPAGAGAFGANLLKMAGVRDDVGKAILFGEGGKNEQDIAGGVAGGAAAGATAGTFIFPGVGTAVGGILGGIVGGLSSAFDDLF